MALEVRDAFGVNVPSYYDKSVQNLQECLSAYTSALGKKLQIANQLNDYNYNFEGDDNDHEVLIYGRLAAEYNEDEGKELFSQNSMCIDFPEPFPFKRLHFTASCPIPGLLFAGQTIAARGTISTQQLLATEIYTNLREEPPIELPLDFTANIVTVCGPYVQTVADFDNLARINQKIRSLNPDFVIFLGPFASLTQIGSEILTDPATEFTAAELTEKVTEMLTSDINCPIATVGAGSDALSLPVYPHGPLPHVMNPSFNLGDPSFIDNKGLSIALTTFDAGMTIRKNMVRGEQFDWKTALTKTIVSQVLLYPGNSVDFQPQFFEGLLVKKTPHLIVMPSCFFELANEFEGTTTLFMKFFTTSHSIAQTLFAGNHSETRFIKVLE